jgi:hypothetical protein
MNGEVFSKDPSLSFHRDADVFELGSISMSEPVEYSDRSDGHFSTYSTIDWGNRISIRRKGKDVFNAGFRHRKERIHFGIVAHEVLSNIQSIEQLPGEILQLRAEGLLSESEFGVLREQLERLMANPAVRSWFEAGWDVRTETPILTRSGHEWKPDRILTRGDAAIVIDFKTGTEEEEHKEQVRNYRKLMEEMGYARASSYLLYISKNKVVEVK